VDVKDALEYADNSGGAGDNFLVAMTTLAAEVRSLQEQVEDLQSENENLQIEHGVMFCRLRDANGQYTPDEVSKLIDAEIKAKSAESV
jgi:regulator of replication initiation timing